jgi:hypothetical protein
MPARSPGDGGPCGILGGASFGAWRSLVARTVRVGEVPGSNPGAPIVGPWSRLPSPPCWLALPVLAVSLGVLVRSRRWSPRPSAPGPKRLHDAVTFRPITSGWTGRARDRKNLAATSGSMWLALMKAVTAPPVSRSTVATSWSITECFAPRARRGRAAQRVGTGPPRRAKSTAAGGPAGAPTHGGRGEWSNRCSGHPRVVRARMK